MRLTELLRAPLSSLHTLRETKLCLDFMQVNKGDTICEIGLGTGFTSLILSKRFKRVVGIDISMPLVEALCASRHPDNVEFYAIDATKEPPNELLNQFGRCICIDVLEHVEDPLGLLTFISRILRRGGGVA